LRARFQDFILFFRLYFQKNSDFYTFCSTPNTLDQETDLYKILDVPKYASQDEIKRKYHHLAKMHHPDAGGDTEIFVQIQAAFATLGDVEKRKAYNDEKRTKERARIKVWRVIFGLFCLIDN